MARDHARIQIKIWDDGDFRSLTGAAQLLYFQLLSSPTLTYAGVADWRPKRIAVLSRNATPEGVESAMQELIAARFAVVDEETEEAFIRSIFRWDGLLQQPNLSKSVLRAHDKVTSLMLRSAIVDELSRLREEFPDWKAFTVPEVIDLIEAAVSTGVSDAVDNPSTDPNSDPKSDPSAGSELTHALTDATLPSPFSPIPDPPSPDPVSKSPAAQSAAKTKRGTRLVDDWMPSQKTIDDMRQQFPWVDLQIEHEKFCNYWIAKAGKDAVKLDWERTWKNWIIRAAESGGGGSQQPSRPKPPQGDSPSDAARRAVEQVRAMGGGHVGS